VLDLTPRVRSPTATRNTDRNACRLYLQDFRDCLLFRILAAVVTRTRGFRSTKSFTLEHASSSGRVPAVISASREEPG